MNLGREVHHNPAPSGSFERSAKNITIDGNGVLHAELEGAYNEYHKASIDLNYYLGNDDGEFQWGGTDFIKTATDLAIVHDKEGVIVLRAELCVPPADLCGDGGYATNQVRLGEHIGNNNGQFEFHK
ncbi:Cyanovirin-N [Aspergillus japonicus CBS 114.51]|uniref:Cyanovirin-N n=2 Tax=Aspergillus TaxID=5052 RepID=A0A2V5GR76_ASPV1|nr:Cyanovirin-N [Aspergillus japonicus CBS 114.51]PYI13649.1 Cyanovirin-N [Aspergillus violaceofuscus CBS 115571]RAH76943.1 Cyanovirin-N [Aspergillus japonicus CBS 114.51]